MSKDTKNELASSVDLSPDKRNKNSLKEFKIVESIILDERKHQNNHQIFQSNYYSYPNKPIIYESQINPNSQSIYNPNISTVKFLSEMDLRCDDHLNRLKQNFQADRYWSDCKSLCCDSCVIEYHYEHINSAKIKVEEYFKKQKCELEEIKADYELYRKENNNISCITQIGKKEKYDNELEERLNLSF